METIKIRNQYETQKFIGSKKEVLAFLRNEVLTKREDSRKVKKLAFNVHSLPVDAHSSKLVTVAAFKIKQLGKNDLIELLNAHGVQKYSY